MNKFGELSVDNGQFTVLQYPKRRSGDGTPLTLDR